MKHYLLLLLLVTYYCTKAQEQPSNIGTVYNYDIGDTLQYRFEYNEMFTGVSREGYQLIAITGKTVTPDTIFYTNTTYHIYTRLSPPSMPLTSYIAGTCKIAHPDSSIVTSDPELSSCQVNAQECFDSVYRNVYYNGRKQYHHRNIGFYRADIKFADSLGRVFYSGYNESAKSTDYSELIYYRKANGETWGTYDLMVGINEAKKNVELNVFPNPANNQLHTSTKDAADKTVIIYTIDGSKTAINTSMTCTIDLDISKLSPAIYFVEVKNKDGVGRYKFVKQ